MRRRKPKLTTPFIYAREQFGLWNVFIDGVPMKGSGFGGVAEFMSEASALAAAHTTVQEQSHNSPVASTTQETASKQPR